MTNRRPASVRRPTTPAELLVLWNFYTDPGRYCSDHQHKRRAQAARALDRMIQRRGIRYRELSNGARVLDRRV